MCTCAEYNTEPIKCMQHLTRSENSYIYIIRFFFVLFFMHLADAFIQSDLQAFRPYIFFGSVCVFPGN